VAGYAAGLVFHHQAASANPEARLEWIKQQAKNWRARSRT
jgi:hypothetical protein